MLPQLAVFIAGLLTAITGFGFNAVSLPFLAVAFEPHHAVVVGLLDGLLVFVFVFCLPGVRHAVDWRLVWKLFGWSLPGLPLGALLLLRVDERSLRLVIGALTFAYAAGQLLGVVPPPPSTPRGAPYVGLLSGVLSSSVSLGGTPVMLYLIALGGAPRDLRATAVAYVILSTIGSLVALSWTGLVDPGALTDAALLAPAALVGFGAGAAMFRHLSRMIFVRLTLVVLAIGGLVALSAGLR
jgi:uncharacterized protein